MDQHWANDAIIYHIYPLGMCGAPQTNDFHRSPVPRLEQIYAWLDHIQSLGANAIYLGPLFESDKHGYDTVDYNTVDRRLGTNETLAQLSNAMHQRGLRLILDGVFNHTGRGFWAFQDVLKNGQSSPYCDWFAKLNFGSSNPLGDPFTYEGWQGHYDLVKLNLRNPAVKQHLFNAVTGWIDRYQIDGLRLDAADCVGADFLKELSDHCRRLRPDFWMVGEIIHGNYRAWVENARLDSVTNYEAYKGLYSSLNDKNYFEIAYTLDREFGQNGLYKELPLYNFADNHDVNRVTSTLHDPAHLYPLYILLFAMPGVPSIYYGSEWGISGQKSPHSDQALRPALDLNDAIRNAPHPDLVKTIQSLAALRHASPALRFGDYHPLLIQHQQLAFARRWENEFVVIALNATASPSPVTFELPAQGKRLVDLLNPGESFTLEGPKITLQIPANWGRIMRLE